MNEQNELPLKRFSSKVMLNNIDYLRSMIQRIRQQEGGLGSVEDELSLYRAIQDLDLLVDIADGLKAAYDDQQEKLETVASAALTLQNQNESLKSTYERMVQEREDRIKALEAQLDPDAPGPEPDPNADTE